MFRGNPIFAEILQSLSHTDVLRIDQHFLRQATLAFKEHHDIRIEYHNVYGVSIVRSQTDDFISLFEIKAIWEDDSISNFVVMLTAKDYAFYNEENNRNVIHVLSNQNKTAFRIMPISTYVSVSNSSINLYPKRVKTVFVKLLYSTVPFSFSPLNAIQYANNVFSAHSNKMYYYTITNPVQQNRTLTVSFGANVSLPKKNFSLITDIGFEYEVLDYGSVVRIVKTNVSNNTMLLPVPVKLVHKSNLLDIKIAIPQNNDLTVISNFVYYMANYSPSKAQYYANWLADNAFVSEFINTYHDIYMQNNNSNFNVAVSFSQKNYDEYILGSTYFLKPYADGAEIQLSNFYDHRARFTYNEYSTTPPPRLSENIDKIAVTNFGSNQLVKMYDSYIIFGVSSYIISINNGVTIDYMLNQQIKNDYNVRDFYTLIE